MQVRKSAQAPLPAMCGVRQLERLTCENSAQIRLADARVINQLDLRVTGADSLSCGRATGKFCPVLLPTLNKLAARCRQRSGGLLGQE
jgi:hypothetical protein